MNKIHSSQLFAILMLSGAWSILCIPQVQGSAMLAGILAALGIQLLMSIPMLLLVRDGFSLSRTAARKKWLGIIYLLFFLLWGAVGFSQLWEISAEIELPVSGSMAAAVLMVITCLYTCSLGLHAMARSAPLVLGILLLSVLVLLLGAYSRVDITRLTPPTDILPHTLSCFCLGGELTAAFVLLDRTAGKRKCAVLGYLLCKAAFAGLVCFLCICAAGRLAGRSPYPFFTLTALSQPLQSQRADALYLLVFVMLFVMHITLHTGVIAHLLHDMFPRLRGAAPLSLVAMLLLSWGLSHILPALVSISGVFTTLTAFAIPLLFYLNRRFTHETNAPAPPAPRTPDGMRNGTHQ